MGGITGSGVHCEFGFYGIAETVLYHGLVTRSGEEEKKLRIHHHSIHDGAGLSSSGPLVMLPGVLVGYLLLWTT
jgi:hypothetical protein